MTFRGCFNSSAFLTIVPPVARWKSRERALITCFERNDGKLAVEAEVRGQDVGVKKSETELAKQRNNYAKCMQNPVGASQNRTEKNKRFFGFLSI